MPRSTRAHKCCYGLRLPTYINHRRIESVFKSVRRSAAANDRVQQPMYVWRQQWSRYYCRVFMLLYIIYSNYSIWSERGSSPVGVVGAVASCARARELWAERRRSFSLWLCGVRKESRSGEPAKCRSDASAHARDKIDSLLSHSRRLWS